MKVGSLVECVSMPPPSKLMAPYCNWTPVIGETYTVKEIQRCTMSGDTCISVEENSMGRFPDGEEIGADIKHFSEIQSPMDLSELLEETQQIHS